MTDSDVEHNLAVHAYLRATTWSTDRIARWAALNEEAGRYSHSVGQYIALAQRLILTNQSNRLELVKSHLIDLGGRLAIDEQSSFVQALCKMASALDQVIHEYFDWPAATAFIDAVLSNYEPLMSGSLHMISAFESLSALPEEVLSNERLSNLRTSFICHVKPSAESGSASDDASLWTLIEECISDGQISHAEKRLHELEQQLLVQGVDFLVGGMCDLTSNSLRLGNAIAADLFIERLMYYLEELPLPASSNRLQSLLYLLARLLADKQAGQEALILTRKLTKAKVLLGQTNRNLVRTARLNFSLLDELGKPDEILQFCEEIISLPNIRRSKATQKLETFCNTQRNKYRTIQTAQQEYLQAFNDEIDDCGIIGARMNLANALAAGLCPENAWSLYRSVIALISAQASGESLEEMVRFVWGHIPHQLTDHPKRFVDEFIYPLAKISESEVCKETATVNSHYGRVADRIYDCLGSSEARQFLETLIDCRSKVCDDKNVVLLPLLQHLLESHLRKGFDQNHYDHISQLLERCEEIAEANWHKHTGNETAFLTLIEVRLRELEVLAPVHDPEGAMTLIEETLSVMERFCVLVRNSNIESILTLTYASVPSISALESITKRALRLRPQTKGADLQNLVKRTAEDIRKKCGSAQFEKFVNCVRELNSPDASADCDLLKQQAEFALQSGDEAGAERIWRELLERQLKLSVTGADEKVSNARWDLISFYAGQNKINEAEEQWKLMVAAVQTAVCPWTAHQLRGFLQICISRRAYILIEKVLEQAFKYTLEDPEQTCDHAVFALYENYLKMGEIEKAESLLLRRIAIPKSTAPWLIKLAELCITKSDDDEGNRLFDTAIAQLKAKGIATGNIEADFQRFRIQFIRRSAISVPPTSPYIKFAVFGSYIVIIRHGGAVYSCRSSESSNWPSVIISNQANVGSYRLVHLEPPSTIDGAKIDSYTSQIKYKELRVLNPGGGGGGGGGREPPLRAEEIAAVDYDIGVLPHPRNGVDISSRVLPYELTTLQARIAEGGDFIADSIDAPVWQMDRPSGLVRLFLHDSHQSRHKGIHLSNIKFQGRPVDLQIFYGGERVIELAGKFCLSAVVFAPNAQVQIKNNATLCGAVVAKHVYIENHATVLFDLDLLNAKLDRDAR